MKNVVELREKLSDVVDDLLSGKVKHYVAKEVTNACGKMLQSSKQQLEKHALSKTVPKIRFLEET